LAAAEEEKQSEEKEGGEGKFKKSEPIFDAEGAEGSKCQGKK
jgi:hypothetical protein